MKNKEVQYGKSYEMTEGLGLRSWEKIGIVGEMEDGDNYEDCLQKLKNEVESFHQKGQLKQIPQWAMNEPVYPPDTKQSAEQRMIDAINGCTSLSVLETFKPLVKNNQIFQQAYDLKMGELSKTVQ